MEVSFRTDASPVIGSGHLIRCLALADALKSGGATCHFLMAACPDGLARLVQEQGHQLVRLALPPDSDDLTDAEVVRSVLRAQRPDWLVVDHYQLDLQWESRVADAAGALMAIDDLANRHHDCRLLLDQTPGRDPDDYRYLTPPQCRRLIGLRHALMRTEFSSVRRQQQGVRAPASIARVLITLGGMDSTNVTGSVLEALRGSQLPDTARITVVMGSDAPWRKQVEQQLASLPWRAEILSGVRDMATLMSSCDLAISAAGSTLWELCCIGLPMIAIVTADNQRHGAAALKAAGGCVLIDDSRAIGGTLPSLLNGLLPREPRATLSANAWALVDGDGARRTAAAMQERY